MATASPSGLPHGATIAVCENAAALMQAAAERFIAAAATAIDGHGRFVVALAGGSTPKSLYALLATPAYATRVAWDRVHVCWGDERAVPPDDRASNYRMTHEALLAHVPINENHIHRIRGEVVAVEAASIYEHELRQLLQTSSGPPRPIGGQCIDLVLLGLGTDGHTASLFPGSAALAESSRWVVAEYSTTMTMWRVTMTPRLLNAAANVLFVVSGKEKADIVLRVLKGPRQPDLLPAQAIAPQCGQLTWLLDKAAAAQLT